jgi:hypothetical protein
MKKDALVAHLEACRHAISIRKVDKYWHAVSIRAMKMVEAGVDPVYSVPGLSDALEADEEWAELMEEARLNWGLRAPPLAIRMANCVFSAAIACHRADVMIRKDGGKPKESVPPVGSFTPDVKPDSVRPSSVSSGVAKSEPSRPSKKQKSRLEQLSELSK